MFGIKKKSKKATEEVAVEEVAVEEEVKEEEVAAKSNKGSSLRNDRLAAKFGKDSKMYKKVAR